MMDLDKYNRRKQMLLITFTVIGGLFLSYIALLTKVYFLTSVVVLNPLQLNSVFHAYQPIIKPYQDNFHCCEKALTPGGGRAPICSTVEKSEQTQPWLIAFKPKIPCSKLCPAHNLYRKVPLKTCFYTSQW